jgi:hypothetical protein
MRYHLQDTAAAVAVAHMHVVMVRCTHLAWGSGGLQPQRPEPVQHAGMGEGMQPLPLPRSRTVACSVYCVVALAEDTPAACCLAWPVLQQPPNKPAHGVVV